MVNLTAAGLSPTEAECYTALLEKKEWKPAELAKSVNQTRTNCYKLLDNLVALGLAERFDKDKKLHYRAANPQKLLGLAQARREALHEQEKLMQTHVANLSKVFFSTSDQPGIRFYHGREAIRRVFDDMLASRHDIYLIRSPYDDQFYDRDFFLEFKKKRAAAGINTYILSPDIPSSNHNPANDRLNNMFRTWLAADAYTAPVEWDIYGDTVVIISYGQEAFATSIQSPAIADSLRQIFKLLQAAPPAEAPAKARRHGFRR